MAIKRRKPRNSSLRAQSFLDTKHLFKGSPYKPLLAPNPRSGGRNAYGRITVRHRGGGAKGLYRIIDFKRAQADVPGVIERLEYDPNRNVPIALVLYRNGVRSYILAPEGLVPGDEVLKSIRAEARVGNCLPLKNIPTGFFVHNIELLPGQGGKFARSAGTAAQLVAKEEGLAILKMPSSEVRTVRLENWATIGVLGNADYKNISLGKAGRTRHRGWRPSVRGMAMNPVDHPHGGGEGRSKSGSDPVSPTGKSAKGGRTRRRKSSMILKRRSRK